MWHLWWLTQRRQAIGSGGGSGGGSFAPIVPVPELLTLEVDAPSVVLAVPREPVIDVGTATPAVRLPVCPDVELEP